MPGERRGGDGWDALNVAGTHIAPGSVRLTGHCAGKRQLAEQP
jgi:hypothetical protein